MALLSNRKSHVMDGRASTREKRANLLLTLHAIIDMRADGRPGVTRREITAVLPQFSEWRMRNFLLGLVELGCLRCEAGLTSASSIEEQCNTYFLLPFALAKFIVIMPEQPVPASSGKVAARKKFKAEFVGPILPFTRREYRNMTRLAEIAAIPQAVPEEQQIKMVAGAPLVKHADPIPTQRLRDHYILPDPCALMSLFYKKELSSCA